MQRAFPNSCWSNDTSLYSQFFPPQPHTLCAVGRRSDRAASMSDEKEKQMGPEFMDVDGCCFFIDYCRPRRRWHRVSAHQGRLSISFGGGSSRVAQRVKRASEKELECGPLESIAAKPLTPVINVGNTSISLWMKIRESMLTSAQYQNAALAFTNK